MDCRPDCAACCIAPSISSAIPGMPGGKAAGVACVQLDKRLRCRLFGRPERPAVCASLMPTPEMCGTERRQALLWLRRLDDVTARERIRERLPVAGATAPRMVVLANPDFAALARAYGYAATRITRTAEFEPELVAALARDQGTLIEVMLDPEVITTRGTLQDAIRDAQAQLQQRRR